MTNKSIALAGMAPTEAQVVAAREEYDRSEDMELALCAALVILAESAPSHEVAIAAAIGADPEIGERDTEIMREVLSDMPNPTPADLVATPTEPGLYLDAWDNVWRLHRDGVFSMSSRVRAAAARYAPFKRLEVVAAAGDTPQEASREDRLALGHAIRQALEQCGISVHYALAGPSEMFDVAGLVFKSEYIRGRDAALRLAAPAPQPGDDREKSALRRVWKAMGCEQNPDDFKPNVRDRMWDQVVDIAEKDLARNNRLDRENAELRADLAARQPHVATSEADRKLRELAEGMNAAQEKLYEIDTGLGGLERNYPDLYEAYSRWDDFSDSGHADTVLALLDRLAARAALTAPVVDESKLAGVIAAAQNVPFAGANQKRIARAVAEWLRGETH